MKALLMQYAGYNSWANQKLADLVLSLSQADQQKEVGSSFSSLHLTVIHMWEAENIWWQRIKLVENIVSPALSFNGDTKEAFQNLLQQNKIWEQWISNATEMALQHEFKYHNTKREPFKQPTYQMLLHIFNHGTYHRGQLVSILRQLGHSKIPQTDFIVWARSRK